MTDLLQILKRCRKEIEIHEHNPHCAVGVEDGLLDDIDALIQRAEAEQPSTDILRLEGKYAGVRFGDLAIPEEMTAAEIFYCLLNTESSGQQPSQQRALEAIEILTGRKVAGACSDQWAENVIRAALQRPRVPDGYALVPIGPTPGMIEAGANEVVAPISTAGRRAAKIYRAMLDAAPDQQEALVNQIVDEYELRGEDDEGREAGYTPSDNERVMLKDFAMFLLSEMPIRALQRPRVPEAVRILPGYWRNKYFEPSFDSVACTCADELECAFALAPDQQEKGSEKPREPIAWYHNDFGTLELSRVPRKGWRPLYADPKEWPDQQEEIVNPNQMPRNEQRDENTDNPRNPDWQHIPTNPPRRGCQVLVTDGRVVELAYLEGGQWKSDPLHGLAFNPHYWAPADPTVYHHVGFPDPRSKYK